MKKLLFIAILVVAYWTKAAYIVTMANVTKDNSMQLVSSQLVVSEE